MVFYVCRSHVGQLPAAIFRKRVRERSADFVERHNVTGSGGNSRDTEASHSTAIWTPRPDTVYVFKKARPNVLAVPSATKTGIRMHGHKKHEPRVLAM